MRIIKLTILSALALSAISISSAESAPTTGTTPAPATGSGPCLNSVARANLLCPDLTVARPSEMFVDRKEIPGKVLLRATNDIESRGLGPIEFRGHRDRPNSMAVIQAIKTRSGGFKEFPIQARLGFHSVGDEYGGSYWKMRDPLEFQLWKIGPQGHRQKLVRRGPKQYYCFRDLERTDPGPRSPETFVYPACNQNPQTGRVTLGTSVGWSDIYPSTYDHQWINITGLAPGCYAYVLQADPKRHFYELNETNNFSQRRIQLPWHAGTRNRCS